ncbi:hypothetical protein [Alkalicoccus luteus]|uniref:Uncharacterized protein n=1 Tax=Alkalicoccus luteus TaxID=1237094 RepID=A0A969TT13_9BACI|nr:hypothetical protein [Alkalicoccus luteus]NJP37163.1 hypothetical protein [Alkalicoccus luteus]
MPKHYRDYTVGELIDAGFKVDAKKFNARTEEEAEEQLHIIEGLKPFTIGSYEGAQWVMKSTEKFEAIAFYEQKKSPAATEDDEKTFY